MLRTLLTTFIPSALCATALLSAATASAAIEERVHVVGPIPYGASGDYVFTETYYEGSPVYVLETDATWRLYRRQNGTWYIDFNELDEQWSGTIAIGPNAETPFGGTWAATGQGATPTDYVVVSGAPYASLTDGVYTLRDTLHNDRPVYQRTSNGYTFSIYQRSNGAWHLDFDDLDDSWNGTLAYGDAAADLPWEGTWNGSMVVSPTSSVEVTDGPYTSMTTGTYTFDGVTHNGKPVYQHSSNGYTFSVYQRTNGSWYLDFDAIGDSWNGTLGYSLSAGETALEVDYNNFTISNPTE